MMIFSPKNVFYHVSCVIEQAIDTLSFRKTDTQHPASNTTTNKYQIHSALNNYFKTIITTTTTTTTTNTNNSMCHIATIHSSEDNEANKMSPNDFTMTTTHTNHHHHHYHIDDRNLSIDINSNIKYFVDIYTAALHLRQRMQEENLIHRSYSAYLNDVNSPCSLFHNCFYSSETIDWLIKQQLCKTIYDGLEIFQVLEKLKIIHHVCDLNEFEYPTSGSSSYNNVKYLYRFRLDDGTADHNRSFQQFASIYETYTSLFTLDKSQCRGVDLQQQIPLNNPYDEQPGIVLKGDNLGRMLALRSGTNMQNVERLADDMIMYGLVRFDECDQQTECLCCTNKFHNDNNHQYILSNSHRLIAKRRLDLIALMQNDILLSSPIHHSPPLPRNQSNTCVSVSCPDRSSSICNIQTKTFLNRTQSSYHCNDSLSKLSPSLASSNNCCHSYCSRTLPSTQTFVSSSLIQQQNGRRYQTSGPASSNSSLIDDEQQQQQSNRKISNGDEIDCTTKLTCTVATNEGFRRKKSASLNSPANSENRPTADELERLELPWCWKSYSLKRDRRGYGLILQGQGPCYVERLDPYGSAYTSGIRVNEYIYAIEGVNVLRRSGKEVERLLSMFDKCTIYTVYNRDDYPHISTPPNEFNSNRIYPFKQPSSLSVSLNDYNNNHTNALLTTINNHSSNHQQISYSSSPQHQQHSSPTSSSVDGASSCSISPKQQFPPTIKKGTLSKHFNIFKLTSRSCSNSSSSTNTLK